MESPHVATTSEAGAFGIDSIEGSPGPCSVLTSSMVSETPGKRHLVSATPIPKSLHKHALNVKLTLSG